MINLHVYDVRPPVEQLRASSSRGFMSPVQRSPPAVAPVEKVLEQGETRHLLAQVLLRDFRERESKHIYLSLKSSNYYFHLSAEML